MASAFGAADRPPRTWPQISPSLGHRDEEVLLKICFQSHLHRLSGPHFQKVPQLSEAVISTRKSVQQSMCTLGPLILVRRPRASRRHLGLLPACRQSQPFPGNFPWAGCTGPLAVPKAGLDWHSLPISPQGPQAAGCGLGGIWAPGPKARSTTVRAQPSGVSAPPHSHQGLPVCSRREGQSSPGAVGRPVGPVGRGLGPPKWH